MPQLDKCLKFKSVQGNKADCTLYKITPQDAQNFRHLSSCGTIARTSKQFNVDFHCRSLDERFSERAKPKFPSYQRNSRSSNSGPDVGKPGRCRMGLEEFRGLC